MDKTDQKILLLLQTNGRMSATAIGTRIGLSRTAVQNRIAKMENDCSIEGYTAIINPNAQTSLEAIFFITFADSPCEPILKWLSSLNGVTKVFSLSGETDALISVRLADTESLSTLNDKIKSDERILTAKSQVILSSR